MTFIKAHLAAVGALVVAVLTALQSAGHLDRTNIVQVAIAVLGAVLAFFVQNTDGGVRKYAQAIISSLVVAGQVIAPFVVAGHITYNECLIVAVGIIQGVAVYWTANTTTAATVVNVTPVNTPEGGKHEAPAITADQPNTAF